MDEIVDVIQDGISGTYKAWRGGMYTNKSKEELVKLTELSDHAEPA